MPPVKYIETMMTASQIIDALGGTGKVAAELSVSAPTVSVWRWRPNGIPGRYWMALVAMAEASGHKEINLEALALLGARVPENKAAS